MYDFVGYGIDSCTRFMDAQNCSKCDPRKGDFTPQNVDGIAGFYPMIPKGYKTFRQPNKKAKTQDSILQKSAKLYSQVDWKSGVFAMLHQRTWLKFSSNSATPFGSTNILWAAYYASLEAVHDAVSDDDNVIVGKLHDNTFIRTPTPLPLIASSYSHSIKEKRR